MNGGFEDYLDNVMPARMQEMNIPGSAVALIENARIAAVRVYGFADRETCTPVTHETLFCLQSISKSVAAWGIMKLVEREQLDLERPVGDYLSRWRLPPSQFDERGVTLRRLLCHYAGISTASVPGIDPERDAPSLVDALNGAYPPLSDEQMRYMELWDLSTDWPVKLAFQPGEAFHYANPGYEMLELMVAEVTGQSFDAFVAENVLRPLGMRNSSYAVDPGRVYAKPYGVGGERVRAYRPVSKAAGGLYASVGDLAIFACAEMDGPQGEPPGRGVLSPGSIAQMFESQGPSDASPEIQFDAGLGHFLLGTGDALNVHHSGGSIGWRSIYSIFPHRGAGFCMLVNSDQGNPLWLPLVRDWRDRIFSRA